MLIIALFQFQCLNDDEQPCKQGHSIAASLLLLPCIYCFPWQGMERQFARKWSNRNVWELVCLVLVQIWYWHLFFISRCTKTRSSSEMRTCCNSSKAWTEVQILTCKVRVRAALCAECEVCFRALGLGIGRGRDVKCLEWWKLHGIHGLQLNHCILFGKMLGSRNTILIRVYNHSSVQLHNIVSMLTIWCDSIARLRWWQLPNRSWPCRKNWVQKPCWP